MGWLQDRRSTNDESEGIEIKPEVLKAALKPELEEFGKSVSSTIDSKIGPIVEYITAQQKAQQQQAAIEKQRQRQAAQDEADNIDETEFIVDPQAAVQKMLKPMKDRSDAMAALLVRKEVLADMDYYHDPEFKKKVDALIDAQPLANRSNASVIMNAYKSIYYDTRQEIADGKIKSKTAATNFNGNGTGGHSGSSDEKTERKLTPEEKRYAAKLGVSEADWLKTEKELEYV